MKQQETFTQENTDFETKSDLDYLFTATIRHGGIVSRYYDCTVQHMEDQCVHHNKDCRIATLGKSITMYIGKDNNGFRSVCTFHALQDLAIRITKEGYLVNNTVGGNAHP